MTEYDISIPFDTFKESLRTEVDKKLNESGLYNHNSAGEFNYGGLNHEKSLNTTLFPNGSSSLRLDSNTNQFIYELPLKLEGDRKYLEWFSFKDGGRVTSFTATIVIHLTPMIMNANVPLSQLILGLQIQGKVHNLHRHIDLPFDVFGFVSGIVDPKIHSAVNNAVSAVNTTVTRSLQNVPLLQTPGIRDRVVRSANISTTGTELHIKVVLS